MNKKNLTWYFVLGFTLVGFIVFINSRRNSGINLMKNGVKTTGYCIVEQTYPLAYKQKQLASWIYDVNGKEYKRNED